MKTTRMLMMMMMTKNLGICVTCEEVFIPVTCNKV